MTRTIELKTQIPPATWTDGEPVTVDSNGMIKLLSDGITYDDLYELGKAAGRAEMLAEVAQRDIERIDEKRREKENEQSTSTM